MENDKLKKICIITGGAGGIGYHLSEGFLKKGYKVIVLDINKHKELSKGIDFLKVDLRFEDDIKHAFSQILDQNEANWEAYGASKGGLISMSNTLAISLSRTPITVNAISPGWIQVDNYDDLTEADHSQHPSGRVGIPRDILNACLFLANPENDFINATNLVIDGGMTKKMIYE